MDLLNAFKSLVKKDKIVIDNNIFKLHYKFTVIILVVFCVLLTSKQYFGDPIDCYVENSNKKTIINTYCWIYGTFTIRKTLKEDILTGLGNYAGSQPIPYARDFNMQGNDEIIVQKYYQWVCIAFFLQALLFYIPRYLWKMWEAGRLRLLVKDLGGPLIPNNWNKRNKDDLIKYLLCGLYSHNCYALRFALCEILNFVNVLFQIVLMDRLLTGNFTGYGVAVATFNNVNPMTVVFPKLAKCTFRDFGASGSIQNLDSMCLLPLNVLNEKMFLFLWFWFAFLTLVSFYQIICRVCTFVSPSFRSKLMRTKCNYLSEKHALAIMNRFTFGDIFLLDLLGKNLNPVSFREMVVSMAESLQKDAGFNSENTILV